MYHSGVSSRNVKLLHRFWRLGVQMRFLGHALSLRQRSPAVGAAVPPARALGMSTEVGILLDDLD